MFFKFINKCQQEILRCAPPFSHVSDFIIVKGEYYRIVLSKKKNVKYSDSYAVLVLAHISFSTWYTWIIAVPAENSLVWQHNIRQDRKSFAAQSKLMIILIKKFLNACDLFLFLFFFFKIKIEVNFGCCSCWTCFYQVLK